VGQSRSLGYHSLHVRLTSDRDQIADTGADRSNIACGNDLIRDETKDLALLHTDRR